jgi:hypothetical protein
MLRVIAVLFLSFAGLSCAQDRKITNDEPGTQAMRKRLKSVTWDLASHKLLWVVETGKIEGREFVPTSADHYEISPDEAQMRFAQETRGFSENEAVSLHKLLDTLAIYCAESVVWWDEGQGEKVDRKNDDPAPRRETVQYRMPWDTPGTRWAIARTLVR